MLVDHNMKTHELKQRLCTRRNLLYLLWNHRVLSKINMLFYYISLILATQPSDSAPNKTSTVKNSNLHFSPENKSYAEVLSKPIFFVRFFRLSASLGFFKDSNKETTTPADLLQLKRFRNYFHVEQETWGLYALIKRYFREKWKFRSIFKTVLLYYYTLYCSVLRTRYCFLLSCNNGTFRLWNPDNKTCSFSD